MRKHFIAAAALAFACPAVMAQTPSAQGAYQAGPANAPVETFEAQADSIRLIDIGSVEITATRAGEKTPVAHSNVSREEIGEMNYGQDIPFLLTQTPSVVATSDSGMGIGYTGIRIRGVDATRINVTSNGVPMNDAESHSLYWVNTPDIASSVQDIQVQRGVGTSTNGAGAFGGSINLRTETPSLEPSAEASLSYGSYNTHREMVKVNTGLIDGKWSFGARLSNIHSDGYIERASTDMKSWFAQGGYYSHGTVVKLVAFGGQEKTYHAWDGIEAGQMAANRRYNPCGEITELIRGTDGKPLLDEDGNRQYAVTGYYKNQHDNYIQTNFHLILNQRISHAWNFNATLHYTPGDGYYEEYKNAQSLKEYGLEPFPVSDPDLADHVDEDGMVTESNLIRQKRMLNDFYGMVFSFNYSGDRLTATLGGAANRYDGVHFGPVIWVKNYVGDLDVNHEYYRNSSDKRDMNVFARANYELPGGLNIYADVQYRRIHHMISGMNDKYNWHEGVMQALDVDKTYDFFNPKAGVFYDIDRNNSVYASFGVAHKEPTRNNYTDARFGSTPRPERLFDYELGYSLRSRIFSAGMNLYYMDYKDQLVLTGQTNDIGEPLADNVARSYRTGIELTAGVKIAEWLRWDVNATFSRNRILDYTEHITDYDADWNDLGTQTARYIGETTISYSPSVIAGSLITFSYKGFNAAFQSLYVSSQYVTNSMQDGVKDAEGNYTLDPLKLDAYFVNNLRLDYTFKLKGTKQLTAGVAINNLFNAKYCSNGWGYSSLIHKSDGSSYRYNGMGYFPQATTNVLANLTLKF